MNISDVLQTIMAYKDEHKLNSPASGMDIATAIKGGFFIPREYIEVLKSFNGGELFAPGTVLYGLTRNKCSMNVLNDIEVINQFSIPSNYLIIGHLNFGDIICINTEPPYDVIQWDHETDEEFYKWPDISAFLNEQVEDYLEYKEGNG